MNGYFSLKMITLLPLCYLEKSAESLGKQTSNWGIEKCLIFKEKRYQNMLKS
jgi:hypothetical protein